MSRWVAAWLLAVAIWTWIMSWTPWPVALLIGGIIASLCFAAWQALAFALRLPLALRAPRS